MSNTIVNEEAFEAGAMDAREVLDRGQDATKRLQADDVIGWFSRWNPETARVVSREIVAGILGITREDVLRKGSVLAQAVADYNAGFGSVVGS